jgi:hypothetical protein
MTSEKLNGRCFYTSSYSADPPPALWLNLKYTLSSPFLSFLISPIPSLSLPFVLVQIHPHHDHYYQLARDLNFAGQYGNLQGTGLNISVYNSVYFQCDFSLN